MTAKAATERTHKYYIAKYINRGSSKVVFSSAFSPRTTEIRQSTDTINLSRHQLNNIYIELDSTLSIDFDKVVVACIITSSIEKQRECIENIRLQQLFFSNNMATKIYGIVIMEEEQQLVNPAIEQKPNDGSKYNKEEWTSEPEYSYNYTYHRWNMTDDRESGFDTFLATAQAHLENGLKKTFFVFQERCDFDVVEYVKNEIDKKTRNWDGIYSIKSEFKMIVEKIDHYMSKHIKKYIKKGYIDTDYKPGNVCILQTDRLDSVAAASSAHDKQTWKSFDFDIRYIHNIKGLDESFKRYCKLYMIIQFYVTFLYIVVSHREYFVPIILKILRKNHKIKENTIRRVIIFFADFDEQFHEQYKTEYNKNIYTPFSSLMNYASRYFNKNILKNIDPVKQAQIAKEYIDNKPNYLVNVVWAIFGFSGTSASSFAPSSKSSHAPSSKSSHAPSSASSSKSFAKPGGRKVNSSKKHLNKRASTNTNAITKKSKSK